MTGPAASKCTAVIGLGTIGESWSALFMSRGYDVHAWDPSEESRRAFAGQVDRILRDLAAMDRGECPAPGRLIVEPSLAAAVRSAAIVQENAPESLPLKRGLYAEIEANTPSTTIVASSTSSLVWSDLAAEMTRPDRFVTAHPFNPPHLMPLVEVFGQDTAILAEVEAFYRSLGRVTVRLKKEATGHIANRLSSALWREAVNIVAEGIADVADVDAALVHGPGLRWSVKGAHLGYHLAAGSGGIAQYLRHLGPSQERRWATLGTPALTPDVCARLIEGVRAEAAGRSIDDLEQARDAALRRVLEARAAGLP